MMCQHEKHVKTIQNKTKMHFLVGISARNPICRWIERNRTHTHTKNNYSNSNDVGGVIWWKIHLKKVLKAQQFFFEINSQLFWSDDVWWKFQLCEKFVTGTVVFSSGEKWYPVEKTTHLTRFQADVKTPFNRKQKPQQCTFRLSQLSRYECARWKYYDDDDNDENVPNDDNNNNQKFININFTINILFATLNRQNPQKKRVLSNRIQNCDWKIAYMNITSSCCLFYLLLMV